MAKSETRRLKLSDAALVGWERCFETSIAGYELGLCLTLAAKGDGEVMATITVKVLGNTYRFEESFDGNQCFNIGIVGPLDVEICVSNWTINQGNVTFTLSIYASVFYKIKIWSGSISLPLPETEHIASLAATPAATPQEVMHLMALLGALQQAGDVHVGSCTCEGGHVVAAPQGTANCPSPDNKPGICFETMGKIPNMNCAACCALRTATGWFNPATGHLVTCA